MNTSSNTASESPLGREAGVAAVMSAARPLYWSVRRELWENRSIYIAPLAVASVALLGFIVSAMHLAHNIYGLTALDLMRHRILLSGPYSVVAILIIFTSMIVGGFYCLDALHGERRDRSILFWKSLPVSDTTTVLAKASVPLVILPLVAFALIVALQLIMLLLSSAILESNGISAATLWTRVPLLRISLVLGYGLLALTLWYAPLYAWLLLVSAWAQRAALLWAVLMPLVLTVIEKIAFGTSHVGTMLGYRLTGVFGQAFTAGTHARDAASAALPPALGATPLDVAPAPLAFLGSPGLWAGLAATVALLAAAVWLRRYRDPL
jgi:ABC-2 type transport system permease protein